VTGSPDSLFGMVPIDGATIQFYSLSGVSDTLKSDTLAIYGANLESDYKLITGDGTGYDESSVSASNTTIHSNLSDIHVSSDLYTDSSFTLSVGTVSRPSASASLVIGSYSDTDIAQGYIGDCWLVSSISAVAGSGVYSYTHPRWDPNTGKVVTTKFFGDKLVEILMDDELSYYSYPSIPYYGASTQSGELWVSFEEKSIAKIAGSYDAIASNSIYVGYTLIHPGFAIVSSLDVISDTSVHSTQLKDALSHNSLLSAAIDSGADSYIEGLPTGHAYSIMDIVDVPDSVDGGGITLYRVRNPWGQTDGSGHGEYTGPYCDSCSDWTSELKEYVEYADKDDGIFFIEETAFYNIYDFFTFQALPNEYLQSKILEIPIDKTAGIVQIQVSVPTITEKMTLYLSLDAPVNISGYSEASVSFSGSSSTFTRIAGGSASVGYIVKPHTGTIFITFNVTPEDSRPAFGRVAIFSDSSDWSINSVSVGGSYETPSLIDKPAYITSQAEYLANLAN
ncbi:hypothetical protein ADUPG1_011830, partial [Aduncisulcus paluster]